MDVADYSGELELDQQNAPARRNLQCRLVDFADWDAEKTSQRDLEGKEFRLRRMKKSEKARENDGILPLVVV